MEVEVRKVDQHARFQGNGGFAGGELSFAVDDSKGSVDSGVKPIDFHDDGIQIGHFGVDTVEIAGVDRVDFSHELLQTFRVIVKLNQ